MNKKIASVIGIAGLATSIFFMGCGGSTSAPVAVAVTTLTGTLTDGPISNAKVVLASLKKGKMSNEVFTDANGNYELTVAKSLVEGLDDNDLPYIHAASTGDSKVSVDGVAKDLVEGQVSF